MVKWIWGEVGICGLLQVSTWSCVVRALVLKGIKKKSSEKERHLYLKQPLNSAKQLIIKCKLHGRGIKCYRNIKKWEKDFSAVMWDYSNML